MPPLLRFKSGTQRTRRFAKVAKDKWEAAWIKECKDRLAALDRGKMQTYDIDEVMVEARTRLKRVWSCGSPLRRGGN